MKKKFLDRAIPKFTISLLKGAFLDSAITPVKIAARAVTDLVAKPMKENINSEVGGVGKPDYSRLIGFVLGISFMVWGVYTGKISPEMLEKIIDKVLDIFISQAG